VQRFQLQMMRFSFTISHVPGKSLAVADALWRAPCSDPIDEDTLFQQETGVCEHSGAESSSDGKTA